MFKWFELSISKLGLCSHAACAHSFCDKVVALDSCFEFSLGRLKENTTMTMKSKRKERRNVSQQGLTGSVLFDRYSVFSITWDSRGRERERERVRRKHSIPESRRKDKERQKERERERDHKRMERKEKNTCLNAAYPESPELVILLTQEIT